MEPDPPAPTVDEIRELVPGYETDLSAIGTNREATDPDGDRSWADVHGLTAEQVQELTSDTP